MYDKIAIDNPKNGNQIISTRMSII